MVCASTLIFGLQKKFDSVTAKSVTVIYFCPPSLSADLFCHWEIKCLFLFLFCLDKQDEQKQERYLSSRYGSVSLKVCLHNVECSHKFTQSLSPQCGTFPQIHIKFVSTM